MQVGVRNNKNFKANNNIGSRITGPFCGTIAQIAPRPPRFEVSKSHTIRRTLGSIQSYEIVSGTTQHVTTTSDERTSMPSAVFESAFPRIENPQTYAVDSTATRIDVMELYKLFMIQEAPLDGLLFLCQLHSEKPNKSCLLLWVDLNTEFL
jgi:hypothetical protein